MKHRPIQLFSFGYFGWGNHTKELVEAVNAVEKARGFEAPFFVDVRVRRTVRAKGFLGTAFEKQLGAKRHRWIPGLGNQSIVDGGDRIRIRNPEASEELLDLARQCAHEDRRIIFFCSCDKPHGCHRMSVARLVARRAERQGIAVKIAEWPGGVAEKQASEMLATADQMLCLEKGKAFLPIGRSLPLNRSASFPWGTIVKVAERKARTKTEMFIVTGPSQYRARDGWALPVLEIGESASSVWLASQKVARERQYPDFR